MRFREARAGVLVLAALVASTAVAEETPKVALIVVGPESADSGVLQADLEAAFAKNMAIVGATSLATAIGGELPSDPLPDAPTRSRAAAMLADATDAFYRDKQVVAIDRLGALVAFQERDGRFPLAEHVVARLWRANVYLALGDEEQARAEARLALLLDADLAVDANLFRPSLREIVETLRASLPMASVRVAGAPAGARVEVDGRPVATGAALRVLAGRHVLRVAATGFREVRRAFDAAKGEQTLFVTPSLAISPTLETEIRDAFVGAPAPLLASLCSEAGATHLLLVENRPESVRVMLIVPRDPDNPKRSGPLKGTPVGDVVRWTEKAMRGAAKPVAGAIPDAIPDTTPRPVRLPDETPLPDATPRPVRLPVAPTPSSLALRGSLGFGARSRAVDSRDDTFAASFAGTGPALDVVYGRGAFVVLGEGSLFRYPTRTLEIETSRGVEHYDGGTSLFASAAAGLRASAGPWELRGFGGVAGDSLSLRDVDGRGLLPSHTRVSAIAGPALLHNAGPVQFESALTIAYALSRAETPSHASGRVVSDIGLAWRIGASRMLGRRWRVSGRYEGSAREAQFSGDGAGDLDPPLRDAAVRERFHGISLGLSRDL